MKLLVLTVYLGVIVGYSLPLFNTPPGILSLQQAEGISGITQSVDTRARTITILTRATESTPATTRVVHYDEYTAWRAIRHNIVNNVIVTTSSTPSMPQELTPGSPVLTEPFIRDSTIYTGIINFVTL